MKKILLLSILLCSGFSLLAQNNEVGVKPTDAGRFIVGGNFMFDGSETKVKRGGSSSSEAVSNEISFDINSRAAYFVLKGLALGLNVSFDYSDSEFIFNDESQGAVKNKFITFGPFARYYFNNDLFVEGSFGFSKSTNDDGTRDVESNLFNYQIGVGYAFFLNNHVSVEPVVSYVRDKFSQDNSDTDVITNRFVIGIGLTTYF